MSLLVKIHMIVSVFAFISTMIVALVGTELFHQAHPTAKLLSASLLEKIFSIFRIIVGCCVPIFNALLLISYVFFYDRVIEGIIGGAEKRIECE